MLTRHALTWSDLHEVTKTQLEVVKEITEEEFIKKGMQTLTSSASGLLTPAQPFRPVSGNAVVKKPLWQKRKELKLEEKALLEEEAAERDATPSTCVRSGTSVARTVASANLVIDPTRAGAHILNEGRNDAVLVCVVRSTCVSPLSMCTSSEILTCVPVIVSTTLTD